MLYFEKVLSEPDSPWVVFLHGFGANSRMWVRQKRAFKKAGYNLLLLDLPGHGKSVDITLHTNNLTSLDSVAELIKEVMDEVGVVKANFVALSLGTLLFASFFKLYPDMVDGVVLSGAIVNVTKPLRWCAVLVSHLFSFFPYMFFMKLFCYIILPRRAHKISREFFLKSGEMLGKQEFICWFNLALNGLDALSDIDLSAKKVLIIMGSEDYMCLRKIKEYIKGKGAYLLDVIKNCGHVCNIQCYNEFNKVATQFLCEI